MAVAAADLILYGSASRPEDDTSTSGGAQVVTFRPVFTALTGNSVIAVVSDGADTRDVTIDGRAPGGANAQEVLTLDGTNEVVGVVTFERITKVTADGTDASRTVEVREGSAGAVKGEIPPDELGFYRMFLESESAVGAVERFEKVFWENTHTTDTLIGAQVTLTADPSDRIRIALTVALDDSTSVANRLATPGGVTFVDDSVAQNVPGSDLAAGEAVGVWIEQGLEAGDGPFKSSFTLQCSGATV